MSPVYKRVGTAATGSGRPATSANTRNPTSPSTSAAGSARAPKTPVNKGAAGERYDATPVVPTHFNNFFVQKTVPQDTASGIATSKQAEYQAFLDKQRTLNARGPKYSALGSTL